MMKFTKIMMVITIVITMIACSTETETKEYCDSIDDDREVMDWFDPECVYVCSGPNTKRYHMNSECIGLSRCSGEIMTMTEKEAINANKTPCRRCMKSEY